MKIARPRMLTADEVGRQWAQSLRSKLKTEGRRIVGGWPGTLSEARYHVSVHCAAGAEPDAAGASDPDEREGLARAVYARARREWLSLAARGGDTDEADA